MWWPNAPPGGRGKRTVEEHRAVLTTSGYSEVEVHEERRKGWICVIGQRETSSPPRVAVGKNKRAVLVVVYTEPESDVLRIVSARMATRKERQLFEQYEREKHGCGSPSWVLSISASCVSCRWSRVFVPSQCTPARREPCTRSRPCSRIRGRFSPLS